MTYFRGYYAGGTRLVIDDIPIRVEGKPSATNVAYLREYERYRIKKNFVFWPRREIAHDEVAQANGAIRSYSEALGIDFDDAKVLIEKHRLYLADNPPRDESLEYDL